MIDKKLIPYGGLKKEPFSGTHHGMRYFFRGDDGKSSTTFTVFIYLRHVGGVADEIALHEHIVGRRAVDRRGGRSPMREWMKLLPGFSNALKLRNPNG